MQAGQAGPNASQSVPYPHLRTELGELCEELGQLPVHLGPDGARRILPLVCGRQQAAGSSRAGLLTGLLTAGAIAQHS